MSESIKLKNSIVDKFQRIELDTFDEDTIKGLLIDIREYIRGQAILREVADFIAHPRRDKGISHKLLNARYTKISLVDEQFKRLTAEDGWKDIKTEWGYSHAVLSSVNVDKIKSDLFKILFIDGIEDVSEHLLKKYYKMNRRTILKLLDDSYFQSDGYHILKNLKYRNLVEDILKFIRGALSGKPVFEEKALVKDLESAISSITQKFEFKVDYLEHFKKHRKGIILCMMCLLHDARLTFHDGKEGKLFLTTDNGLLSLGTEGTGFQFAFFASSIQIQDYLEFQDAITSDFEAIPWINARRSAEGRLLLMS
jgi:hypothetical protein